jgi:hypothetical protein
VKMNLSSRLDSPYMLGQFLEEMDGLMGKVSGRWNEISHYLNEPLSEDSTFLEGDKYVELIFEDETYSRSRKYFWVLACLNEFENSLKSAAKQWEDFEGRYVKPLGDLNLDKDLEGSSAITECYNSIRNHMRSMKGFEVGFIEMRAQVLPLRDGVVSARIYRRLLCYKSLQLTYRSYSMQVP